MIDVCFVGDDDVDLREELMTRETARRALRSYDLGAPWHNTVAVSTISLGAAVSLLNDLNWYLVRFAQDAMVRDPSISEDEWVSARLAREIRAKELPPEETDGLLKMYGVIDGRLVEPMYVHRTDGHTPRYDLRDVDTTVKCRITKAEFG